MNQKYHHLTHQRANPVSTWSSTRLQQAEKLHKSWPHSSMMVVDHGRLIASWGDIQRKVKISSVRKSILAILFGILLEEQSFNLDTKIADIGFDDAPPLSESEKQATVRMLLEARSGIYHDYIGGSPGMLLGRPKRDSVKAGEHWYYNNWDFNCVGAIFEKIFNISIPDAFIKYLSKPLEMQDFSYDDFYYYPEHKPKPNTNPSIYPAYHFRMTTRDLSRLGCLLASGGLWNNQRIIPKQWYCDMTTSYSNAFCNLCPVKGTGYGFYFWIDSWPDIKEHNFSARGNLGKTIIVFPTLNLSIICLNHTAAPDDSRNENVSSYAKYPAISTEDMTEMLALLLKARNI